MKNIVLLLLLNPLFLLGQQTTRFFIAENFGLDVDTMEFKLIDKFSNTFWLTNSYSFKYFIDDSNYVNILTLEEKLPHEGNDSFVKEYVKKVIDMMANSGVNDTMRLSLSTINEHNSYYYFIGKGGLKTQPSDTNSSLWGFKCYNDVVMKINCFSGKNSKVSDIDIERVFKTFSDGITYYTDYEVKKADSLARLGLTPKFKILNRDIWKGEIWIESNKTFLITDVGFNIKDKSYQRIFHPNTNGITTFSFEPIPRGSQPDIPTGKGYFIVQNSLGKEVKIEFDFSDEFGNN